jgi:hypothetical protein
VACQMLRIRWSNDFCCCFSLQISCADFARATCSSPASGDARRIPDGMRGHAGSPDSVDINGAVASTVSSSSPARKRKLSDVADESDIAQKKPKPCSSPCDDAFRDHVAEDVAAAVDAQALRDSSCYDGRGDDVGAAFRDTDGEQGSTCNSRRTLYIEYWSRTDECKERKWDHLDEIADMYGCAEEHIFATTLKNRTAFLEPNMFPYDTPAGIEHWTLWHVRELNHEQIKQYVENWIDANAPHVTCWNYDDNPERSIDIFHVHVYFQVPEGMSVLHGRRVEDLAHELD